MSSPSISENGHDTPLRVLHVCVGNLYGGVETFLVTVAGCRHLCPQMETEFAICYPGRLRDELLSTGVRVHDLAPARVSRPWTVLRARKRLAKVVGDGRFDAVVCQMAWVLGLFGGVVRNGRRVVATHHHGPRIGNWVDQLAALQRPNVLIAPSRSTLETWRSAFPSSQLDVLNNPLPPQITEHPGLSEEDRACVRAPFGATPQDVVILQASRMEAWKGPDLTLSALARLRDLPGWRLWFAGGAQRPEEQALVDQLQKLASEYGIRDRVTFLGQRSDIPTLMRAADIYCQGNRGPEGFSLAFLEASYCHIPVVTTDLGGASEMVDAQTGILVPPSEDVTNLSVALQDLIADPGRRAALGTAAHAKAVRLCSPEQQLRRLHHLLAGQRLQPK